MLFLTREYINTQFLRFRGKFKTYMNNDCSKNIFLAPELKITATGRYFYTLFAVM